MSSSEEQAERIAPDALAVEFGARQLTYRQLNQRANGLAHRLRSIGVGPESVVAVALERSPEMIVALLGILKSGGAYLPLDLEYPTERLAFMMHHARAQILLVHPHHRHRLQFAHATPVCLELDGRPLASEKSVNPVPAARSSNLAYVMYTSGSTGKPKGVCVPHRAISRLVSDTNYVQLGPSDRIAHAANVSFDAATFEIWGGLLNGASVIGLGRDLVLSPKPLSEAIRARGITVMFLTTALFNQLVDQSPAIFASLRAACSSAARPSRSGPECGRSWTTVHPHICCMSMDRPKTQRFPRILK